MIRPLALALLGCLFAPPAGAQQPAGWDAFVRAFDDYVTRDSVVGASVLVEPERRRRDLRPVPVREDEDAHARPAPSPIRRRARRPRPGARRTSRA